MNYPREYIRYLAHFHGNRDYFECHEILEEYWKAQKQREDRWVALIQIAVGLYHHRRGNFGGAEKMLQSSIKRMSAADIVYLGINFELLQKLLLQRLEAVRNREKYIDLNLPISDPSVEKMAKEECAVNGWIWQALSPQDEKVIHRHTLRDRSDIIKNRTEKLKVKRHQ